MMDVKEAIAAAKAAAVELLAEESVSNLGLEEVEFDDDEGVWNVTLGFSRPWNTPRNPMAVLSGGDTLPKRTYRIFQINDEDGSLMAVRRRESFE